MNIQKMTNMKNFRMFLTLVLISSCVRAKKLCDVRVWYLNIITAEIFDAELTEDQMSLKESIESFVSNSADNKASKMIGCNVLYMYNDMLKEQFNYVAERSGMILKEIDSETIQKSEEDSKNEFTTKDTKESVNVDGDEKSAFKVDKLLQNDVSENINEDETDTKQNNNEQTQDIVEKTNEIDSHNLENSSEVEPDISSKMHQDDDGVDLNIGKLSDSENTNNSPKNEYPNNDDDSDSYKVDDLEEIAEDSTDVDEELHQFIDLSNEYSDGLDETEIDDTETDIEQNDIETSEEIEELSKNLTDKKTHVSETNESLSTIRKESLPFGVCWSLGCSIFEIFVINTKQNENIPETPIHDKFKVKHDSVRKPGRKKPYVQQTCSLQYFYELVILNAICISNYSDVEQLNSVQNSVTKNNLLSISDNTEKEGSEIDSQNSVKSIDEKEKVEKNIKNEEVTDTGTPNTENSVDEKEEVKEMTKNENFTDTDVSNEEKHIDEKEMINNEIKEKETDDPNIENSIDKNEKVEESIKNEATETDTPNVENSIDHKEKVNEIIKNEELTLPDTPTSVNSIDENRKSDKTINNDNEIKEDEKQNVENANDVNKKMDERNDKALHEDLIEEAGETPLSVNIDASGSEQNMKITDKVTKVNKENERHEPIVENEKVKNTNDKKTNNDINDNESIKHKIESLKEFENIIEQKTNQYYTKIQTLEVLIMKLENQILSEALHKQNHSTTITKLENHVLKLENELLKMNKNYQNLREEADNMSKRQNRYLELAYKQQAKKDYPELPDHSSKNHELISQHQSKLNELAFVIKNQSEMIMHLHKKYESIENQNRQLHQMVMNQTIFMTSIIKTVQDLSEQNLQNQKEIIQLRQKVNENTGTQIPKGEHKDKDSSRTNVIDELDSLLFHNRDEKIVSAKKEIDIKEEAVSILDNSESLLQKYLMKEKSAMELVLDWCPKSTSTCPLCQNYSLIRKNCVPFQFIIWYNNKQNKNKQEVKDDSTTWDHTEQEKLKDEGNIDEVKLKFDSTMENIIKQEKLKGDSTMMDSKKQEIQDDSITMNSIKEEELEDDTAVKDNTKQDNLKDGSASKQHMSNNDNANIDGSQTAQIKSKLPDIALSEDKVAQEMVTEDSLMYDDGFEKYKVLGYDKEGRPVLKMRDDWVEKEKEKKQPNNDEENNMTNSGKKSDLISDQRDPREDGERENRESGSNFDEPNKLSEQLSEEVHSYQASNEEQKVKSDLEIELDNGRLNENVQKEEAKVTDKITNQDLNKNVEEIDEDSSNKDSQESDKQIDNVSKELSTDEKIINPSASDKEISEDSPNKHSQKKTDEQIDKVDIELNADRKTINPSASDKEITEDSSNKYSKEKKDEQIDKVDKELNADKKPIDPSASDKEISETSIKNDLKTTKETDNASNENAEKNIETQKVEQGTDDKKAGKAGDTTSKSTQDSSSQNPKNDESNKEPDLVKVKDSESKNIVDKKTENSQPQKPKQDNTIKGKDKEDSNKKVDKSKNTQTKQAEAENKPKERKVPINIKKNVPKQYEPRDCYDYYLKGDRRDGLYKVKPFGKENTIEVFCDMRRGGWTVIQRRQDGTTNFYQDWNRYKKGFGGLYGEHWLGNDNIHLLSNQDYYKLRVDLMDWNKEKKYAEFEYFLVDNEDEGYRIHIDGYRGDAGDGLTKHDGHKFSTKDVDNDKVVKEFGGSCAKRFNGAGWYYKCYASNLNGKFYKGGQIPDKKYDGVTWKPWTGPNYSLKKVEMKIRPASAK